MDWFKLYVNRDSKEFVFKAGNFTGELEGFSLSDNFLRLKQLAEIRVKWIGFGFKEKGVKRY